MPSFFKRVGIAFGLAVSPAAQAADDPSPMQKHQQIDFVAHDPKSDRVVLSMVETRSWGEHGALLPDFQEKLNTYLGYVLGGQLTKDYPAMKGKKIKFLLQTKFPLGEREEELIEIVKKKYLDPRDIEWAVLRLGTHEKKG
jgi:hypothetical protein